MSSKIKQCTNCKTTKKIHDFLDEQKDKNYIDFWDGYLFHHKVKNEEEYNEAFDNDICPFCYGKLIDINMTYEEFKILGKASNYNRQLLDAMIKLKQDDIIEYELKMSQFRNQVEQQNTVKQQQKVVEQKNVPHCPTCGSTNIKKISATSKVGSVAMWGIFSRKVHKQWHCNNCKSEW